MRINEIVTEDISRRNLLKGLGAAAVLPTAAKAGEYIDYKNLVKNKENFQKIWAPRFVELTNRANTMLNRLTQVSGQYEDKLKNVKVQVKSTADYVTADIDTKIITIDLTVFWDAPDSTLAFVIGHELGHIALGHGKYQDKKPGQSQAEELDADLFGVHVAKALGYDKASVFEFFHTKKEEYEYYKKLVADPNSTHPSIKSRIDQARALGYQLSKAGIEQLYTVASHIA